VLCPGGYADGVDQLDSGLAVEGAWPALRTTGIESRTAFEDADEEAARTRRCWEEAAAVVAILSEEGREGKGTTMSLVLCSAVYK